MNWTSISYDPNDARKAALAKRIAAYEQLCKELAEERALAIIALGASPVEAADFHTFTPAVTTWNA
jgi:hypothetical protein